MARNDAQYRTWLEFIGEVLKQPLGLTAEYRGQLLELLTQSFNGACATRNRVQHQWENRILDCWPRNYIPNEPPGGYDHSQQPLLRWHVFTGQRGPQSLWRVPDTLASNSIKRAWDELAGPWNVNHQLSIPVQSGGPDLHSYLVQRSDRDFTDQELDLAGLLQPILTALAVHFTTTQSAAGASQDGSAQGLTAREMTVLSVLTEGLTADAMSRRLGISPRTAGRHLEHIYRKLDVCDRLMAVNRARELGLLTPVTADWKP